MGLDAACFTLEKGDSAARRSLARRAKCSTRPSVVEKGACSCWRTAWSCPRPTSATFC